MRGIERMVAKTLLRRYHLSKDLKVLTGSAKWAIRMNGLLLFITMKTSLTSTMLREKTPEVRAARAVRAHQGLLLLFQMRK